MAAFGGTLHFDGRPIDRRWLSAFGAAHASRGPDGGADAMAGAAALTARAFHVTPESRCERQPAHDAGGAWLCWDGRLDNANEIEAPTGRAPGARTDTHLVLSAYRRFGADFLGRLVGDFALALWDAPRRRLTLARDCAGTRTLYFQCDPQRAIWSTDLDVLMRFGALPFEPDEDYIADFLAYEVHPARSPFRNVHAVRPAEAVTFTGDGRSERRPFWTLDLDREIRCANDDEYADQFRALFRDAVRVRLRTDRPVVAELSGGLDSSSIVVMADAIVGDGGVPRVETVSRVHEDARSSDERRFIEVIEAQRGRRGLHLSDALCPLFEDIESFAHELLPNPYCFAAAYHRAVDEWMGELGARVLLCGLGGDEIAGSRQSPTPELGDLLVSGKVAALISRTTAWSASVREPWIQTLHRHALKPALPLRIRRHLAVRRAASEMTLYRREYIERVRLRDRLGAGMEPALDGRPSARDQATGFLTAVSQVADGFRQAMCTGQVTYPFLHRPLVEFMQGIPADQKARPGRARIAQRTAMEGLLPDAILHRRSKGNPTEAMARAFHRVGRDVAGWLLDGCVVRRGYADPARLGDEISKLALGTSRSLVPMLKLLSLELWLRALESRARELRQSRADASSAVRRAPGALPHGTVAVPEGDVTCSPA